MANQSPYAILAEAEMYTQSDPLKEVKDMSKNLVSGEFEREYQGVVEKRGRRRRALVVAAAVALVGALLWLAALTVARELQLARLRRQVDDLSANLLALSATVNNLNQKISNNHLFDEFKTLEDTIYADVDADNVPVADPPKTLDVDRLQGLTVLEDADDLEDDEDYDEGESGDWYPDYDNRREKIGKTNMVKLQPEDFTGSVVLGKEQGGQSSVIREIKRMLNENPETPDSDLAAVTPAHTDADKKRGKRSVLDYPKDEADLFRAPGTISKADGRKKKKFMSSGTDETPERQPSHSSGRSVRNSDDEELGQKRPFVAAHFHGNTSHLSTDIHEHYKGNGLVRVAHDSPHDVWYPAAWTLATRERPTLTKNGHVHVRHTGVYLVYAQIYYLDSHDVISWVLHRTNAQRDGREAVLQCAQSSYSPTRHDRPNSCFSAAVLFLKADDHLAVRNTGGDRHSLMQPEKSFIGLVKLADANDPEEEF